MSEEIDREELLRGLDEKYDMAKDEIPASFHIKFKLITCSVALLMRDLSIEDENEAISIIQNQIDGLQNDLNTLIKVLKDFREEESKDETLDNTTT